MPQAGFQCAYTVLILTDAMQSIMTVANGLLDMRARYRDPLTIRVSIDHFRSIPARREWFSQDSDVIC